LPSTLARKVLAPFAFALTFTIRIVTPLEVLFQTAASAGVLHPSLLLVNVAVM